MIKFSLSYFQGVCWFLLSVTVCQMNDALMKLLTIHVHPVQTIFLRFFFGVFLLFPIAFFRGFSSFRSRRLGLYVSRGAILFAAEVLWCFGLRRIALPTAVVIGFSMPISLLLLAHFFLHERISWVRALATIAGFFGVLIVFFGSNSVELSSLDMRWNWAILVLVLSTVLFAGMDILNKKFAFREDLLPMIFYTALATLAFSLIPACLLWKSMNCELWLVSIALGAGADLILFFLLKAFRHLDASSTAPYRYLELLFSFVPSYFLFHELPGLSTYCGAAIIIPATLFLAYYEGKKGHSDGGEIHGCC